MTKLSIIIPTWNTATITAKCVSTINQHLKSKIEYEIVIVDNASGDNTKELVAHLDHVVYVQSETNLGFAKGNNLGSNKAKGDYFLFLNSDMELVDSQLISMLNYLSENPHIGAIGPKFLNPDLTDQASVFPPQTPLNAVREYWFGQKDAYSKYIPLDSDPVPVWALSGGAVLISKDLFNKIGKWSSKYFMYFEDLELCRQIRRLGLQIYYFPGCSVIHRHGASGKSLADTQNQWRRLIPSSKIYHGLFKHYLLFLIMWLPQKIKRTFSAGEATKDK